MRLNGAPVDSALPAGNCHFFRCRSSGKPITTERYFVISFAVAQAASRLRPNVTLSFRPNEVSGEIYIYGNNTNIQ